MSQLSFQLSAEIDRKSNVLTWRLPKRQITNKQPVPERENPLKNRPVFGRRPTPPIH